jgi:hypothetical protein
MAYQPAYAPGSIGGPSQFAEKDQTAQSTQQSISQQQSTQASLAGTYIPDYAESPILREIAQYARSMAPQVYQWGMEQFNKNQGNIDTMLRNALTYASPQRIAAAMGQTEAGVMQGAEQGRQNAIRDLQSFGIDPSSGRYAALDKASQVMAGAQAAGSANLQRQGIEAMGTQMQGQAIDRSLGNVQLGYGAAGAMNQLLGTGMALKYPPLGQTSMSAGQSTGSSASSGQSTSGGTDVSTGYNYSPYNPVGVPGGKGSVWATPQGVRYPGGIGPQMQAGGGIDDIESPSGGERVDDVPANLTAGEFVIPKDVTEWKGQEFFYKLMAQARKTRAMAGSNGQTGYGSSNGNGADQSSGNGNGYQYGGDVSEQSFARRLVDPATNFQLAGKGMSLRDMQILRSQLAYEDYLNRGGSPRGTDPAYGGRPMPTGTVGYQQGGSVFSSRAGSNPTGVADPEGKGCDIEGVWHPNCPPDTAIRRDPMTGRQFAAPIESTAIRNTGVDVLDNPGTYGLKYSTQQRKYVPGYQYGGSVGGPYPDPTNVVRSRAKKEWDRYFDLTNQKMQMPRPPQEPKEAQVED